MARTTRSSTRAAASAATAASTKEPPKKKGTKAKVDAPKKKVPVVKPVEEPVQTEGMKVVTVEACKS